jgi:hypothetical protein
VRSLENESVSASSLAFNISYTVNLEIAIDLEVVDFLDGWIVFLCLKLFFSKKNGK